MGSMSSWSYTAKATFWAPAFDEFNQPSIFVRSVFNCSFIKGGELALDSQQQQFLPETTIYLEATDADAPEVGWRVVLGEVLGASPPSGAEIVRVARKHDSSTFNEGTPDRVIMTG